MKTELPENLTLLAGLPSGPLTDVRAVRPLAAGEEEHLDEGEDRRGRWRSSRWPGSGSRSMASLRSTPSSMITKRNSTTMAPAYTMTCTAARNCAFSSTKSTAMPNSVITSMSAEWTGLRASDDAERADDADDRRDRRR